MKHQSVLDCTRSPVRELIRPIVMPLISENLMRGTWRNPSMKPKLLQEDGGRLLQESGSLILLDKA